MKIVTIRVCAFQDIWQAITDSKELFDDVKVYSDTGGTTAHLISYYKSLFP